MTATSNTQMPWQIIVIGGLAALLVLTALIAPLIDKTAEKIRRRREPLDLNYEFNWGD